MSFMAFLPEIMGAVTEGGAAAGAGEAAAGAGAGEAAGAGSKFGKMGDALGRAQEFHQAAQAAQPSQPSKPTQDDLHNEINNTMKGGI